MSLIHAPRTRPSAFDSSRTTRIHPRIQPKKISKIQRQPARAIHPSFQTSVPVRLIRRFEIEHLEKQNIFLRQSRGSIAPPRRRVRRASMHESVFTMVVFKRESSFRTTNPTNQPSIHAANRFVPLVFRRTCTRTSPRTFSSRIFATPPGVGLADMTSVGARL